MISFIPWSVSCDLYEMTTFKTCQWVLLLFRTSRKQTIFRYSWTYVSGSFNTVQVSLNNTISLIAVFTTLFPHIVMLNYALNLTWDVTNKQKLIFSWRATNLITIQKPLVHSEAFQPFPKKKNTHTHLHTYTNSCTNYLTKGKETKKVKLSATELATFC